MEDTYLCCVNGLIYMVIGKVPNMRPSFRIGEVLTPNERIRSCLVQGENIFLHQNYPPLVWVACQKENKILILELFTCVLVRSAAIQQGKHLLRNSYSTTQLYNIQL
jgi:hypothetical protein